MEGAFGKGGGRICSELVPSSTVTVSCIGVPQNEMLVVSFATCCCAFNSIVAAALFSSAVANSAGKISALRGKAVVCSGATVMWIGPHGEPVKACVCIAFCVFGGRALVLQQCGLGAVVLAYLVSPFPYLSASSPLVSATSVSPVPCRTKHYWPSAASICAPQISWAAVALF